MVMKASEIIGCMVIKNSMVDIEPMPDYMSLAGARVTFSVSGSFNSTPDQAFSVPDSRSKLEEMTDQMKNAGRLLEELEELGFTKPGQLKEYMRIQRERLERAKR